MSHIFISYARKDGAAVAEELADRLRAFDHDVFLDVHSIRAGTHWRAEIRQRIRWADIMIVLVTPSANESQHVREEITLAERFSTAVVPIQIAGTPIPDHLRSQWQVLKLDEANYDRVLLEIEHAINRLPRKPRLPLVPVVVVGLLVLGVVVLMQVVVWRSPPPADATPTPPDTAYTEDFEDGAADGWYVTWGSPFTVAADSTGNQVWRSAADGEMAFTPSLGWRDFAFQMRYYVAAWDNTAEHIGFLVGIRRMAGRECNRYGFYFIPDIIVMDATDETCDTVAVFATDAYTSTPGQWHDFYIEARGTEIQWRVDDGQLHVVNDDRYTAGSLAVLNLHSSEFWFDDLHLWSFDS